LKPETAAGTPGTGAQTAEEREREGVAIHVYPVPATRRPLAEYLELNPTNEDPTGIRVTFTNLPLARNTIRIHTASGDLVASLAHDLTAGSGHPSWNMMSRNGQEVVSGVHLNSVRADDRRFDDFGGKFVVIRQRRPVRQSARRRCPRRCGRRAGGSSGGSRRRCPVRGSR
jgi:hypothetical protein